MWGAEPSALAGGGFGDGGAGAVLVPSLCPPGRRAVFTSLTGEAPSQICNSWRAAQELQGWAASFAVPLQPPGPPVPSCDTWLQELVPTFST